VVVEDRNPSKQKFSLKIYGSAHAIALFVIYILGDVWQSILLQRFEALKVYKRIKLSTKYFINETIIFANIHGNHPTFCCLYQRNDQY
jgi:hypothetical protein